MKLTGKAAILAATVATSAILPLSISAAEFTVTNDIAYVDGGGASQVGNLYLPKKVTSSTPMVLTIHGGAWAGGDRASWRGVAEFFAKDLGYAAFNIEYRLAGASARWPACGDDCVAAAQYLLSSEFKSRYGFGYDKIWICGGSAGGHLALWTLVNLPANKVAGCIAISPIGDPAPDYAKHPSRYSALFGDTIDLDAMNPCLRITAGMAPVLITHAPEVDQVVPIESSKTFAQAYRAAGNSVNYFEYPCDLEPNEAGHCIWRPGSSPHRLINSLESKIAFFARNPTTTGEWTARAMGVSAVNRTAVGTVASVDLQFGDGNGLTNRLYLAYGEAYGGDHMVDWEQTQFVGEVTDDMSSLHVNMPGGRNFKFFLDVPFPGNQIGVPVKNVIGTGTQYIDTGVHLRGGDDLRCTFSPAVVANMGLFGTRTAADKENIGATCFNGGKFFLDYNSSEWEKYRLMTAASSANRSYDIVLSANERSVSGVTNAPNKELCEDVFTTTYSCYLFKISGSPFCAIPAQGAVSAFSIERNGGYVASYVPYRFGETYGFFDRATGAFFTAVEGSGDFSGTEDASLSTPLTSVTETIRAEKSLVEIPPRTISSCTLVKDGGVKFFDLVFGTDNGLSNKLYIAYGVRDKGTNPVAWEHLEYLGVVAPETNAWRVAVPSQAWHCRFFLSLPTGENVLPVALGSIVGGGSGYFDTGFKINGGDAVQARVLPAQYNSGYIFGSRGSSANNRNVVASFLSGRFLIDYNNSNYAPYRYTGTQSEGYNVNRWFDVVASSEERSATDVASGTKESNSATCSDTFVTATNCYLFFSAGQAESAQKFSGKITSFTITRDGGLLTSLSPCRIGSQYGFYDRVNGRFISAVEGTFSGEEDAAATPLFSVSDDIVARRMFEISFR